MLDKLYNYYKSVKKKVKKAITNVADDVKEEITKPIAPINKNNSTSIASTVQRILNNGIGDTKNTTTSKPTSNSIQNIKIGSLQEKLKQFITQNKKENETNSKITNKPQSKTDTSKYDKQQEILKKNIAYEEDMIKNNKSYTDKKTGQTFTPEHYKQAMEYDKKQLKTLELKKQQAILKSNIAWQNDLIKNNKTYVDKETGKKYTPEYYKKAVKYDQEELNKVEKELKKINLKELQSAGGYVAKKAGAGITRGTIGIGQAALTENALGLKQGQDDKSTKNILRNLVVSNPVMGSSVVANEAVKKLFKNDKRNIKERAVDFGLDIVGSTTTAPFNAMSQLEGMVMPKDSYKEVLKMNKKISKPIDKIDKKLAKEGAKQSEVTNFVGDTADVVGNMLPSMAASFVTKNPNVGLAIMGVGAKGTSTMEALKNGEDFERATKIGTAKGSIEVGTELLTGGLKMFGKGALDDVANKGIAKIVNKVGSKNLPKTAKFLGKALIVTKDIVGENMEETISDVLDTAIDKNTYNPDAKYTFEDWKKTVGLTTASTIVLNILTHGVVKAGNLNQQQMNRLNVSNQIIDDQIVDNAMKTTEDKLGVKFTNNDKNIINEIVNEKLNKKTNNLTENEQAVIDNVVKNRTDENSTKKEVKQIREQVKRELERGYLDLSDIEKVFANEEYTNYTNLQNEKTNLQNELNELNDKKYAELTVKEADRKKNIENRLDTIDNDINNAKRVLNESMVGKVTGNDTLLQNVYAQEKERSKAYVVDENVEQTESDKIINEDLKKIGANNSIKVRDLVDLTKKVSNDTKSHGWQYRFVNDNSPEVQEQYNNLAEKIVNKENISLEEAKKRVANKTINGFKDDATKQVFINIDSNEIMSFVVGHETMHVLEGSSDYKALKDLAIEYSKAKGTYETLKASKQGNYDSTELEEEISADVIGDLFTDIDFVRQMSTQQPSVFEKAYKTVKHLYKMATVDSAEARQLEKLKYNFDKVYNEYKKSNKVASNENTQFDIENNVNLVYNTVAEAIEADPRKTDFKKYSDSVEFFNLKYEEMKKAIAIGSRYALKAQNLGYDNYTFNDNKYEYDFEILNKKNNAFGITNVYRIGDGYSELTTREYSKRNIEDTTPRTQLESTRSTRSDSATQNGETSTDNVRLPVREQRQQRTNESRQTIESESKNSRGELDNSSFSISEEYDNLIKERGSLEARLKRGQENYSEYARRLSYTNDSETRTRFEQWNNDVKETREKLTKLDKQIEKFEKTHSEELNDGMPQFSLSEKGTLAEGIEKQGTKIMEQAIADENSMIENFKTYLEENDIKNPTQKDIDDSLVDLLGYDNEQTETEKAKTEQKYNKVIKDYLKENNKYSISEKDSNGRTLTKQQQEYFKDSKVVDDDGNLKEVYHGSNTDFNVFKNSTNKYSDYASGKRFANTSISFFTDSDEVAQTYIDNKEQPNRKPRSFYLKITNPYIVDAERQNNSYFFDNDGTPTSVNNLVEKIYNSGKYDGVIIKNVADIGYDYDYDLDGRQYATDYVVFNSNQIKNTDNTSPTSNEDIRYSISENGELQDNSSFSLQKQYDDIANQREDLRQESLKLKEQRNKIVEKIPNYDMFKKYSELEDIDKQIDNNHKKNSDLYSQQKEIKEKLNKAKETEKQQRIDEINKTLESQEDLDSSLLERAKDEIGTTTDLNEAGYLTTDGEYLDFSGKSDGAAGGKRQMDHREISNIYSDEEYELAEYKYPNMGTNSAVMQDFIDRGNIRLMPEQGIDISTEPTAEQYDKLYDYIDFVKSNNGEIFVDLDTETKNRENLEYKENISTSKIINDIKEHYKNSSETVEYSISETDSTGRTLSTEQREFFKDSKVVDDNGNLKVMYHGASNGNRTEFKSGMYFTDNKQYADGYQQPEASVLTTSKQKTVSNPKTYEVYLNITNPFDIKNNATAKDIYINEYIKNGNSMYYDPYTDYTDTFDNADGIDWVEANDLQEWLEKNHPEFDGLVLDEGGSGGYGLDYEWHGLSYVTFNPNQIKSVDNTNPTSNNDIRYSISDKVQEPIAPIQNQEKTIAPIREDVQNTQEVKSENQTKTKEKQIAPIKVKEATTNDPTKETSYDTPVKKITRKEVRQQLLEEMGVDETDLANAKDISSPNYQITDPIRVNEKVFGRELGKKINEVTVERTKHNTAEKTRWLNQEREEIKALGIKARSKESAAVQKYGEGQYVNEKGELVKYGDQELMNEFKDVETQNKIKRAAKFLRGKYDQYIDQINDVLEPLGYDPIPKRKDYMRHFEELGDVFSQTGIPFNLNDIKAEELPTDINGLTEFNRPGKNWFASSQKRYGVKSTYDAITGIDGYLEGAGNLIYHTEDIQRYRALSNLIRETYGAKKGFEKIENLTNEEAQQRIKDIQSNKLSRYVAWIDEQANSLAGKKGAIDRGVERAIGRKAYTVLNTIKKQTGSNMTGFNVRSAMTNFISSTIAAAKTNKVSFAEGTVATIKNMFHNDGFIDKSDFLTARFGSKMLSSKAWQKASNAGQIFMTGSDYITANIITRSKYYEGLHKGMSESEAIHYADDFAARVMGDRSQGATAEIFNSKTLGILTQFQLEVNNQWQYMIHDSKMDFQKIKAESTGLNAGATILFQMGQLAGFSYLFNELFEKLTGSRAAFDPIEIIKELFGIGDDDDDKEKKTLEQRIQNATSTLMEAVPFASLFSSGGRLPISEMLDPITTTIKAASGGTDKYGNKLTFKDIPKSMAETVGYYVLPAGYSQLRKTTQGLSMFSKDKEVKGSYTDSGNLRFPVKDTTAKRVQAALFGRWASSESREYRQSGMLPLNEKQTKTYKEISKYGMEYNDYIKYKKTIKNIVQNNEDDFNTSKQLIINEIKKQNIPDEGKYALYNSSYHKNSINVAEKIGVDADTYLDYSAQTFKADKDKNGKSISGSKKKKVAKYINSMNIDGVQKATLYKLQYPSDTTYDREILEYIVGNDDISYSDSVAIINKLGFVIDKKGNIKYAK